MCNTPGVLDDTTADLAFLLILAATRQSTEAESDLREGRWKGWGFGDHLARDVHGMTLGLVGFGRIARAVAQRAAGFDMEVIHTARHDTGLHGYVPTLDELLQRSDIVSLHVPLTESTRHLIGAAELALMKPTAVLVNTARGPVVDENALADALEAGAALRRWTRRLRRRAGREPPVALRAEDHAPASYRQCHDRNPDPHGALGLPGSRRRLGRPDSTERSDNAVNRGSEERRPFSSWSPTSPAKPRGRGIRSPSRSESSPGGGGGRAHGEGSRRYRALDCDDPGPHRVSRHAGMSEASATTPSWKTTASYTPLPNVRAVSCAAGTALALRWAMTVATTHRSSFQTTGDRRGRRERYPAESPACRPCPVLRRRSVTPAEGPGY